MAAPFLTHDIICIGSHELHQHDFHAANAKAVHELFTGGLAPAGVIADCLAGPRVTTGAVERALKSAAERGTTNHIVYFSGRGTTAGLQVSNGTITAEMLGRHLSHVRAHAVLLILDLAIGAEPDHALLPEWLRTLIAGHPGARAAVARATRIGAGVEGEGLARFTAAFVSALDSAPGDLRVDRSRFISDKQAMEHARRLLCERWGTTNFPLEAGTFGDMPLARCQTLSPLGSASLDVVVVGMGLSASVTWVLDGRANMKTTLRFVLERADGVALGEGLVEVVATNPLQKGKTRVRLPKSVLGRPRGVSSSSAVQLRWRVSLLDGRGRVLADCVVNHG